MFCYFSWLHLMTMAVSNQNLLKKKKSYGHGEPVLSREHLGDHDHAGWPCWVTTVHSTCCSIPPGARTPRTRWVRGCLCSPPSGLGALPCKQRGSADQGMRTGHRHLAWSFPSRKGTCCRRGQAVRQHSTDCAGRAHAHHLRAAVHSRCTH